MAAKPKPDPVEDLRFEEALEQLEEIVEAMEGDRMPLDEMLTGYERGTRLLKVCQSRIEDAQRKIELIAKKSAGEIELKDFDEAGDDAPASKRSKTSTTAAEPASPSDEIELL